jgi:hypothetical protein
VRKSSYSQLAISQNSDVPKKAENKPKINFGSIHFDVDIKNNSLFLSVIPSTFCNNSSACFCS